MVISKQLSRKKICVDLIGPYKLCKKEKKPNNQHTVKTVISELLNRKIYKIQSHDDFGLRKELFMMQILS